jgi:hypothetical protein
MTPQQHIHDWFIDHGQRFRHVALTAVPFFAAPRSAQWLFTHFGQWIRTYHFIPSQREACPLPEYDQTKRDFLQWIQHIDCLVDDHEENINDVEAIGVKGILFPRPWNSARDKSIETIVAQLSCLE